VNSTSPKDIELVLDLLEGAAAHGVDMSADAYPWEAGSTGLESSVFDEGFRERLAKIYGGWREAITEALRRGQQAGKVHAEIKPAEESAFLVAALTGTSATGKVDQQIALFRNCLRVAQRHVDTLRP
jgi:hypothetical protein